MKRLLASAFAVLAFAACAVSPSGEAARDSSPLRPAGDGAETSSAGIDHEARSAPERSPDLDPEGGRHQPIPGPSPEVSDEARSPTSPDLFAGAAPPAGEERALVGQGELDDGTRWELYSWQDGDGRLCIEFRRIDPPTIPGATTGGEARGHGCGYKPNIDQAQQIGERHRFVYGPVTQHASTVSVRLAGDQKIESWVGASSDQGFYLAEVPRGGLIRSIIGRDPAGAVVAELERDQAEEAAITRKGL